MAPTHLLCLPVLILGMWSIGGESFADEAVAAETAEKHPLLRHPVQFIDANIKERYSFAGLAFFYNSVRYVQVEGDVISPVEEDRTYTLGSDGRFIAMGRFRAVVLSAAGGQISLSNDLTQIDIAVEPGTNAEIQVLDRSELASIDPVLDDLRYSHLFMPLAELCKLIEWSLVAINGSITSDWGLTIVIYSILLKILLIPLSIYTVRLQRVVSQQQAALYPVVQEIKSEHKGEEAHKLIMKAHKDLGISPFYALKPAVALLIQIPILIATFNALGEMSQFRDQSFLWVHDLAYPDSVGELPFHVPLLGNQISILPMLMTAITLVSTVIFQNKHAPEAEVRSQKRSLYLMAFAFLILFYPFPAAMVLYWALANVLQTIQQQILRI